MLWPILRLNMAVATAVAAVDTAAAGAVVSVAAAVYDVATVGV
jgi:hypothetical protein